MNVPSSPPFLIIAFLLILVIYGDYGAALSLFSRFSPFLELGVFIGIVLPAYKSLHVTEGGVTKWICFVAVCLFAAATARALNVLIA